MTNLWAQFEAAWKGVGCTNDGRPAFDRLLAAYAEPHRHYHTLEHIEACLSWLDKVSAKASWPHEVLLAIWYHDAVYNPLASDNESRSERMAVADLVAAGAYNQPVENIEYMIFATRDHAATWGDNALLIDIDLSILGAPPAAFERFEQQIRQEYAHVEPRAYAAGRAAVLKRLAARAPLYSTPVIAAELETQARVNLAAAIAKWEAVAR